MARARAYIGRRHAAVAWSLIVHLRHIIDASERAAASFGRVGRVALLVGSTSGVGFALLASCSDPVLGGPDKPPYRDGGSVSHPDGTVSDASGPNADASDAITYPDVVIRDGAVVDADARDGDGGSSTTPRDVGSDGATTAGCGAVPVPTEGAGRELHVTTTGNDSNADGSAARPYGSLAAAVRNAVAGETVIVHGGIYALTSAQVLNANGRAGSPVTIRAADGENVVFDGAAVQLGNYDGLIRIGGSYTVVDGLEVVNSMGGGIQLVAANQAMIRRCRIHNIAFQALGGSGNDIVLQQNEVYDSVTSNTNGKVDIANNGFGWSPAVLSFWIGGTMTPSRRWTVENNHIHDNWGECLDALHLEDSVFRGNRLHDCYSVNLYVDDARGIRIEGNSIYNSTSKYNRAVGGESAHGISMGTESAAAPGVLQDITVANNLILSTSVGILYARFNGLGYSGVGIYYNVVAHTRKDAVWCDAAATASGVLRNNVFFKGANNNAVGLNSSSWMIDHNLWPNGGQQGTASIVADPQFSAPGIGGTAPEGFRLQAGSPALSAGTPVMGVPNDYACKTRSTTAPSIGIYE
jgi:hypothetical protein